MRKKKKFDEEKETKKVLIIIFFVPIIIFALDAINMGRQFFPYLDNLNKEYDWLSFIGTYSGTIVSAFFLLFITRMDRRDNNEILRQSQRPYLDVNWTTLSSDFVNKNINNLNRNLFIYNNYGVDSYDNAKNHLALEIRNTGASTAIVDVNKSRFILEYNKYIKTVEGNDIFEKEIKEIKISNIVKRKSLSAGESMYIVCNSIDIYNIKDELVSKDAYIRNTEIYYKDLFNYQYEDICEYINRKVVPDKDNERVVINK